MYDWYRNIQNVIDEIDACIKNHDDEALTLSRLAKVLGYSEFYVSRKFSEISGMSLRDYMRYRRLAFALRELRDTERGILDIALDYGFSSHEAFTRAFREAYGITPSEYRKKPVPVVLRTILRPFDCYLTDIGGLGMKETNSEVKTYFITIPAHKFLHIRNYESIGYWDFWQKQNKIPGQDCETICGLLDSIKGKLDCVGGEGNDSFNGQVMAFINEPEGEYLVFEHGPFDFETENVAVEQKIEQAMKDFDYAATGYELDTAPGRVFYFYHDCKQFWKYVRPVHKINKA